MGKAVIPPAPKHIFTSTCIINDEFVVVLFKGNGASDPETGPTNVEQVTCDTNGASRKDENV